jgi:hypothetical protein
VLAPCERIGDPAREVRYWRIAGWGRADIVEAAETDRSSATSPIVNYRPTRSVRPRSTPSPDFLQNPLKRGLWSKAHGSISIQEGQPRTLLILGGFHDSQFKSKFVRHIRRFLWLETEIDLYEKLGEALYSASRLQAGKAPAARTGRPFDLVTKGFKRNYFPRIVLWHGDVEAKVTDTMR